MLVLKLTLAADPQLAFLCHISPEGLSGIYRYIQIDRNSHCATMKYNSFYKFNM